MITNNFTSPFVLADESLPTENNLPPSQGAGLLSNMRLAVKDLFDIKGMTTTAGNPIWASTHDIALNTNSSVERLIAKGAQFVGKTITDELAYSLNGQNIHYGTPTNPINPQRLPGGSSSGSATAVSAELADIGLGTDTGGSIRVPASYNGLFGIRPTHGVIACDNMVALAPSFDTIGWMTRDLSTLKKVAQVLLPHKTEHSWSIEQCRLAVLDNWIEKVQHSSLIKGALSKLQIFDISKTKLDSDKLMASETFRILQGGEIWQTHGDWIQTYQPQFAQDIAARFDMCSKITDDEINSAKQSQTNIIETVQQLFEKYDVIILPTTPGLSPLLSSSGQSLVKYRTSLLSMTAIAGLCGVPQLHLPLFNIDGAPCGISLLGPKNSEVALMELAKHLMEKLDE